MSALAARRAAAAAAVSSPAAAPITNPTPKTRSHAKTGVQPQASPSPSASASEASGPSSEDEDQVVLRSESDQSDSQPEAGPSKRRRKNRDSSPPALSAMAPPGRQRYFVAAAEEKVESPRTRASASTPKTAQIARAVPAQGSKRKQVRRFSPSAPASLDGSDEEDVDDEEDAGAGDSSDDEDVLKGFPEPVLPVLRSRADWTNPPTPRDRSPRPGHLAQSSASVPQKGKRAGPQAVFKPVFGTNVFELSEEQLASLPTSERLGPGALVYLEANGCLMIAGVFTITPLRGAVTVFSNTLNPGDTPNSYTVFAPTSHPLPVIAPLPGNRTPPTQRDLIVSLGLPAGPSVRSGATQATAFLLRECQTGIEGMRAGAVPGFANAWLNERGPWGLRGVHPVVGSFATPVYAHITPAPWSEALSALLPRSIANGSAEEDVADKPVVALVKGPKRSGKSTMARAALNTLLEGHERVAWLETDLGQGEFAPGGVVGLWVVDQPVFGPAFTHPRLAAKAHFLGTYTPLGCPDEYIAAVQDLLQYYRFELQYPLDADGDMRLDEDDEGAATSSRRRTDIVPLVINTQGWVKGLGEELLNAIEAMADPSHIFAFDSPSLGTGAGEDVFDSSVPAWERSPPPQIVPLQGSDAKLFVLPPAPASALQTRHNAADFRALALLAYLYRVPGWSADQWDFSRSLLDVPPVLATLGEEIKQVYIIGEGSEGIVQDDLALALNGSIVALLARTTDDDAHVATGDESDSQVYVQGRRTPPLDETNFIGYALVRAVRSTGNTTSLQLITPLAPAELSRVSMLVKNGAMEIPTAGLIDWTESSATTAEKGEGMEERPFFDSWEGGVGAGRRRIRRNLQRR